MGMKGLLKKYTDRQLYTVMQINNGRHRAILESDQPQNSISSFHNSAKFQENCSIIFHVITCTDRQTQGQDDDVISKMQMNKVAYSLEKFLVASMVVKMAPCVQIYKTDIIIDYYCHLFSATT